MYNDERVVGHFHMKLWVCVSENFDVRTLAIKIIDSGNATKCGDLTMDQIQIVLRHALIGKTFFYSFWMMFGMRITKNGLS